VDILPGVFEPKAGGKARIFGFYTNQKKKEGGKPQQLLAALQGVFQVLLYSISSSALLDVQLTLLCVCGVDSFLPELKNV